jgi:predicted transport protein
MLRAAVGDTTLKPQQIKESLARLWRRSPVADAPASDSTHVLPVSTRASNRSTGARKAWATRKQRGAGTGYSESQHTAGKSQEALDLYRAVDDFCVSLNPAVERRYLAKTINYVMGKETFCSLHILRGGLRVWLKLKYSRLENPPEFGRDMTGIGHWGPGDLELAVSSRPQLEETLRFVRMSFDACKP